MAKKKRKFLWSEEALEIIHCMMDRLRGRYRNRLSGTLGTIVRAAYGCPIESYDSESVQIRYKDCHGRVRYTWWAVANMARA